MNITTQQLIERIEYGVAQLKSGQFNITQQYKVLDTISALTREHAKDLIEKESVRISEVHSTKFKAKSKTMPEVVLTSHLLEIPEFRRHTVRHVKEKI